jgi:histidine triad (HIT) family protein
MEADCVFCRIVHGEAEASRVYEDDVALAFPDIRPVTPGHTLVIPKAHASYLADLDEQSGAHLFSVGMRLAAAFRASGLRCEGVNFFLADGAAAGQEVFHVHLHVLPRFPGDGFRFPPEPKIADRSHLDAMAEQIRQALAPPIEGQA